MKFVNVFLKMCIISDKLTLACGNAFMCLIFSAATNGLYDF